MNTDENMGSKELMLYIIQQMEVKPNRLISFQQFMEICLYHPDYGYYRNDRVKIGKEGDYYTSSFIGTIMGEMLAQYIVQSLDKEGLNDQDKIHIVEWGSGTGRLANQVLNELQDEFPDIYKRVLFTSVESSDYHRESQYALLDKHKAHIQWLSDEEGFETGNNQKTIIYSNELLDAFPVHLIQFHQNEYCEIFVGWDQDMNRFLERLIPITSGPLSEYIDDNGIVLIEGQRTEINLAAEQWMKRISEWLESGILLTIDYGDESNKIHARERMNGTLMCYHKHQAHDNPYIHLGEQDITAHVNFTSCIRIGEKYGLNRWRLLNQKDFLIEAGIMNKLQNHVLLDPFHPIVKKNRAIRQILLSDQMSELFKVMVQVKNNKIQ